jgi:F-type H+-transporting ATPase subunit b
MFNEKFWLAIAFVTFVALIFKYGKKYILNSLDEKSKIIAKEIMLAEQARIKAEEMLIEAKNFLDESKKFAERIKIEAESEAEKLIIETKKSAQEEIAKKISAAKARIDQEKMIMIKQIKSNIVDLTVKNLEEKIQKIDQKNQLNIINSAIKELNKTN